MEWIYLSRRGTQCTARAIVALEAAEGSKAITSIHRKEPWTNEDDHITVEDSEFVLMQIRHTPPDRPIDLILHTPGGLALESEMIAIALKGHAARVRVIVPFYATSGGRLKSQRIVPPGNSFQTDRRIQVDPRDQRSSCRQASGPARALLTSGRGRMNWFIWVLALLPLGLPVGALVIDRIVGLPASRLFRYFGPPAALLYFVVITYALVTAHPLLELIGWGVLGGLLGTATLDAVRLLGVRLNAFPMDMPIMFGVISLGLAPRLQQNMLATMVMRVATLPSEDRRAILAPRLPAIARLPEPQRVAVLRGMRKGLSLLSEEQRTEVLTTQMQLMAELPTGLRKNLMRAMDLAMRTNGAGPYGQPRGLPRLPMAVFRELMRQAYPRTLQEAGIPHGRIARRGYLWHFLIGATFGITYTLLFGTGSWALAFGWGSFVWLGMMVLMPPMMPTIRFPWWFPGVPLMAHLAMAIPIGFFARFVSPAAAAVSLVGLIR